MKKILLFANLLLLTLCGKAQSIDCDNMCVTNIAMNTEGGLLDITIINGSTQINYPIVTVIVDGDTVGNIGQQFFLFAHIPSQEVVHTIPTTLTSVPGGFTCTVTIEDSTTGEICVLEYPCLPNSIGKNDVGEVQLYPNPAADLLRIECDAHLVQAEILDVTGSLVMSARLAQQRTLSIAHLPAGTYFLRLQTAGGDAVLKSFVKH
jgi:hypothetical protein